jgi:peptide/nickel transport system substrate-binding protein
MGDSNRPMDDAEGIYTKFRNDSVRDHFQNADSRRSFLKGLGLLGSMSLAGCMSGFDNGSQSNNNSREDSENSSRGGDTQGRTFQLNAIQRFGTIDPAKGTDYTQVMALVNLYDPLIFPDKEGNIKPHLAEKWSVSDDNKTYTFTIRKDATFHSGNPVTAEDVKFTTNRFLDINQGYAPLITGVLDKENVTVEGKRTVSFTLNKVYSPFLATMALLFIADKKLIMDHLANGTFGKYGDYGQKFLNEHAAGSGAYKLKDFRRGSYIAFEKYDEYRMPFPDGAFENVRVEIIKKDPTVRALMKKGKLDMTSQYQTQETYQTLDEMDGVRVKQIPTVTLLYCKINTQKPPTDDIAVRKAMAWGFNYETARTQIYAGNQAQGPLAPSFDVHNNNVIQPTYNPKKAKQILANAGYAGSNIKINMAYVGSDVREEQLGLLFQQNMAEIGIDVELKPQTWSTMTKKATSVEGTPHVNEVFYGPVYPSPYSVFYNQYHSESPNTWMSMEHLDSKRVDSLIYKARDTVDPEKRAQIYAELQKEIATLYPDIFTFVQIKKHAMWNYMKGYTFRPAMSFDYWFHDYYYDG